MRRGFTLIELLVVIAMIAMTAISSIRVNPFLIRKKVRNFLIYISYHYLIYLSI